MEGSARGGEVCGLLTSHVSCVLLGPWRRELPCSQAARCNLEASEGAESQPQGASERQGPEGTIESGRLLSRLRNGADWRRGRSGWERRCRSRKARLRVSCEVE
eukprot:4100751-Pleurochrysis_carterae.AAC.1